VNTDQPFADPATCVTKRDEGNAASKTANLKLFAHALAFSLSGLTANPFRLLDQIHAFRELLFVLKRLWASLVQTYA